MRIALNGMLLRGEFSGVEVSIYNLLRAVATAAPDDQFLITVPPGFSDALLARSNVICHYAPTWTGLRMGRIIWEQTALPRLLSRYGIDLLHAPGYTMPLRWRGPTVLTIYDILALREPQWCKATNVWHYRLMLPQSIRRAARIIVPSTTVKEELIEVLNADPGKISVIPLGADHIAGPVTDKQRLKAVRDKYGLPPDYLICVGNIEPKKNIEGTVKIFEEVAGRLPHHLVLVGRSGWQCRNALARIRTSPVSQRIHRLGYVPLQDLPALYSGAAACLHFSWYEGFGLPPLEAMRCGTPMVVSNRAALPEVVGGAALIADPNSPQAAAAIIRLLTDAELARKMVQRGHRRAAQFTWSGAAAQTVKVYREVVEDGYA